MHKTLHVKISNGRSKTLFNVESQDIFKILYQIENLPKLNIFIFTSEQKQFPHVKLLIQSIDTCIEHETVLNSQ